MPTFEDDHFFLLDLATILKPQSSYRFDYTFGSIDEEISFLNNDKWEHAINRPEPVELDDITPWYWYTQYSANCAFFRQTADLNGLKFREICEYEFEDDETLYMGHFVDLY